MIAPVTPASELFTLASMILTLPDRIAHVDALTVVRGLGQEWTVRYAIDDRNLYNNRYLFVASANSNEATYKKLCVAKMQALPYNLRNSRGVRANEHMENTPDQGRWISEQVKETGVTSAALYAPGYHMVRAYLTVLKSLFKNNQRIILLPRPVPIPPSRLVTENGQSGWEMAHAEADRIPKYQLKGDVATLVELQEYLEWMWKQPLMQLGY